MCKLLRGLLLLLFIPAAYSCAQEPSFKHFGTEDGLSSNEVYKAYQDSKGFMWFTTDGGVCRYDGTSFEKYTTKNGLGDNSIFYIQEDHKHRIWFYGFSGKISYFYNDSMHILQTPHKIELLLKSSKVNTIYVDKNDTLWLGINAQNYITCKVPVAHPEHARMIYFYANHGMTIQKIDSVNFIYTWYTKFRASVIKPLGFDISIYAKGNTNNKTAQIPVDGIIDPNSYYRCIKLKNGTYLASSNNYLIQFNEKALLGKWDLKKRVISLYEDENGYVWIGLWRGGVKRTQSSKLLSTEFETFLPDRSVSCVKRDHEGGYWFSTLDAGVYYTPSIDFTFLDPTLAGIRNKNVLAVVNGPGDKIYFTLDNGALYMYSPHVGIREVPLIHNGERIIIEKTLFADNNKNIWFNGTKQEVFMLDKSMKVIRKMEHISALCFAQHSQGGVWASHNEGVTDLNLPFESFQQYRHYNEQGERSQLRTETIIEHEGFIYMGALDGLWRYKDRKYEYLGKVNKLLKNRVVDIKEDADKNLWLATKGEGIIVYNTCSNSVVAHINEKKGLISDLCNVICFDKKGYAWVGTNSGLSKININLKEKQFTIENYNTSHGLISNQVTGLVMVGDKLFLGTHQGLAIFDISKASTNRIPPPVYITSITFNEKEVPLVNATYKVAYDHKTISFKYTGLSFKSDGRVNYKYRLEGLDTGWIYTSNASVRYPELSPGSYTFKVCASNNDGYWSIVPANVSFEISPPYWYTWWFITSTATLLCGSILYILKYRIAVVKKQEKQKTSIAKQMAELELKALKARMNPHFMFNTINSIQHYIVKSDPDKAYVYLAKYAKLMRSVFDNSSEPTVTINEEIETLKLYIELEALRLKHKLTYTIAIAPEIDTRFEKIPALIIQPFVENAIWHGIMGKKDHAGHLIINFILHSRNVLLCEIEDNGVGRKEAARSKTAAKLQHKSGGIQVTSERLQILNQSLKDEVSVQIIDLMDENENSRGTKVLLYMPIS